MWSAVPNVPLDVIAMPEFKRGVAIAYCDAPGPLEKNGKTFFAVAPTPKDWSKERKESFFREYNNYMIRDLTVHEAMPGHFLQLARSNEFRAPTLVRAIFQSGPFIEGWAVYCEQVMAEQGYGGPEVKMQQLKMRLRAICNAILDQSIHAGNMSEKEAMDLMTKEGYQQEGEAVAKWKRARLTSAQLSTYFVGATEHLDLRAAEQKNSATSSISKIQRPGNLLRQPAREIRAGANWNDGFQPSELLLELRHLACGATGASRLVVTFPLVRQMTADPQPRWLCSVSCAALSAVF